MLKGMEALQAKWEDTDKMLAPNRLPRQQQWTDPVHARGTPMHANELIRRVRNMNPRLWAEDSRSVPGFVGFYYESPAWQRKFTGAYFPAGMVSQRVLLKTDTADLATGYELGWQQVLNRLLRLRLISWQQIKQSFPTFETELSREFYWQARDFKN